MSAIEGHDQHVTATGHDHETQATDPSHGGHSHRHGSSGDRGHEGTGGAIADAVLSALHVGGHGHGRDPRHDPSAPALNSSSKREATRVVYLGMIVLGLTAIFQAIIFLASGSLALLGDTVHNFGDAFEAIPLLFAFWLAGRAANRRYTYGYGRAEDLAGLLVVLSMGFSALYLLWAALGRLLSPAQIYSPGWVAAAAIVGFAGNELVAAMQVRAGRALGSEALIASGLHARADGLTSLAVLAAATGAWLGFPVIDAVVGIVMGLVLLLMTGEAARSIWYRLMDAVDPAIVGQAEHIILEHPEVKSIAKLRVRWVGHSLQVESVLAVGAAVDVAQCSRISGHIRHHLYHELPAATEATIAVTPGGRDGNRSCSETFHHDGW